MHLHEIIVAEDKADYAVLLYLFAIVGDLYHIPINKLDRREDLQFLKRPVPFVNPSVFVLREPEPQIAVLVRSQRYPLELDQVGQRDP